MKVLYDIQDMLEDELKKISKKEDMTTSDLENTYKIVDIIKDVSTIDAMKQGGYSQEYSRNSYGGSYNSYDRGGSYNSYEGSYARDGGSYARRGRDGDGDGRYSEESSYARGGRGSYESGYSRHGKEDMIDHLKEMMRNARNEEEREAYRKTIEQLQR